MKSIRVLLEGLIDYAGLFPPAALEMRAAVRNYASYRRGEHSWALGRFITPLARLDEFRIAAAEFAPKEELPVSALVAPGTPVPASIDVVEIRAGSADEIRQSMESLGRGVTAYFEIGIAGDPTRAGETACPTVQAIAEAGARAKVRTGGLTQEMFPSTRDIARFLRRCAGARVAFKATAGLHHPIRSAHPFTYDPDSACGVMHGFLNLFLAAVLIWTGGSEEDALRTLEEQTSEAFHFDEQGVSWHGHRLEVDQLAAARRDFAIGFGSCSFEEPLADLQAMQLL